MKLLWSSTELKVLHVSVLIPLFQVQLQSSKFTLRIRSPIGFQRQLYCNYIHVLEERVKVSLEITTPTVWALNVNNPHNHPPMLHIFSHTPPIIVQTIPQHISPILAFNHLPTHHHTESLTSLTYIFNIFQSTSVVAKNISLAIQLFAATLTIFLQDHHSFIHKLHTTRSCATFQ